MRGESARPGKRPLRALSASEKMDAIQRVHEGESKASVARDIGVPESTLRGWCKSEHKIRGMARNSSTPDSEAHSPASSSGAANNGLSGNANNLSSEDEGGPCTKKSRMDRHDAASMVSSPYLSANDVSAIEADAKQDKAKIDYVSLMTSMAAGMRPENSSLLLQQLGLLSGASGTLAKNLLGMATPGLSAHTAVTGTPVGLVENGLRYTKGSSNAAAAVAAAAVAAAAAAGISPTTTPAGLVNMTTNVVGSNGSKRHGVSAIAPSQIDSINAKSSCGRKSLPAAAEAPITPVPASPRKTNDTTGLQRSSGSSGNVPKSNGKRDTGTTGHNKKVDEALWLWLTQQQQLLGQQSASYNPSINQQDGSWFWQWYKRCSFPLPGSAPVTPIPVARKSPTKAKAVLDNVLCHNVNNNNNNNNEDTEKRGLNPDDEDVQPQPADDVPTTTEEAIEHGEKFFKWLDKCSDPSVTRLQIMQFKYLLDNLKTCRKRSSSAKHSRK